MKKLLGAVLDALDSPKGHKLLGALGMLVLSAAAKAVGIHLPW